MLVLCTVTVMDGHTLQAYIRILFMHGGDVWMQGEHHYLGGRFVPPEMRETYKLSLPPYSGTSMCVKLDSKPPVPVSAVHLMGRAAAADDCLLDDNAAERVGYNFCCCKMSSPLLLCLVQVPRSVVLRLLLNSFVFRLLKLGSDTLKIPPEAPLDPKKSDIYCVKVACNFFPMRHEKTAAARRCRVQDPLAPFEDWFQDACKKDSFANSVALTTVFGVSQPAARMVLLKASTPRASHSTPTAEAAKHKSSTARLKRHCASTVGT
jgi:hypothetical protein